jgi:hypothetical protein
MRLLATAYLKLATTTGDLSGRIPHGEAEKHPNIRVSDKQVAAGGKIELEHTDKLPLAKEIAADHLAEIPDYYTRLEKMEEEADAEGMKRANFPSGGSARGQQQIQQYDAPIQQGFVPKKFHDIVQLAKGGHPEAQDLTARLSELYPATIHGLVKRAAISTMERTTGMDARPRGDEVHPPLMSNPYASAPEQAPEYENGYSYAQTLGHQTLNQATEGDVQRWSNGAPAWRDGFAAGARSLGCAHVAEAMAANPPQNDLDDIQMNSSRSGANLP